MKLLVFETIEEAQAVNERLFSDMKAAGLLAQGTTAYAEIGEYENGFAFVIIPDAEAFLTDEEKEYLIEL